jgi:titin
VGSTGSFTLSWTAVTGTGDDSSVVYDVQRAVSPGTTWVDLPGGSDLSGTSHSFTVADTGLTWNSSYKFRVRAQNSLGNSAYSTESASAQMLRTVPSAPGTLASSQGWPTFELSWGAAPSLATAPAVTSYQLQRALNSSFTGATTLIESDTLSYVLNTATVSTNPNTTYYYRVAARNVVGLSAWSTTLAATTPTTPGLPTGLAYTSNTYPMAFSWSAPSSDGGTAVTAYKLRARPSTSVNEADWVYFTPGNVLSTTVTGLSPAVTYTFQIRAENLIGAGPWSSNVLVTTPTYPGAASGLQSTSVTPTAIALSWTAPSDTGGAPITGYRVELYSEVSGMWSVVGTPSDTSYSYQPESGLTPNTIYTFRVRAVNGVGISASASTTLQVVSDNVPTGAPSLTLVSVDPSAITFSWDALAAADNGGDPVTSYLIQFYDVINQPWDPNWVVVGNIEASTTTFTHTSGAGPFPPNMLLRYRILPVNGVGSGLMYSPELVVLADDVPQAPTNFAVTYSSVTRTLHFTWDALTDLDLAGRDAVTGYVVEWDQGTGTYVQLGSPGAADTEFSNMLPAPGLSSDTTYSFRIRAVNGVDSGQTTSYVIQL